MALLFRAWYVQAAAATRPFPLKETSARNGNTLNSKHPLFVATASAPELFLNKTTPTIVGETPHRNLNPENPPQKKCIFRKCRVDREIGTSG